MSRLVVMGSGETAPAMVKVHREVLAASGTGPAVLLDTPFGFQSNADELTARTGAYFAASVGRAVEVGRWRRADAPAAERERTLALLSRASWAFAGPGSPTYALRQWLGTPLPGALADVVRRGGTLVVGSAAAVTLGERAIPVYEIYKAGFEPWWTEGLGLLERLAGLPAVLVPHYDNAEGGTYDTRFCYLGEERLALLEEQLPTGSGVLGVDEHTALLLDLAAGTARIAGASGVTVRRRGGVSRVLPAGTQLPLAELAAMLRGEAGAAISTPPVSAGDEPAATTADRRSPRSLRSDAEQARAAFDAALDAGDVDRCVSAVLGLEEALVAWSADTLQSDDADRARRELRAMIVRLGELALVGVADPRDAVEPYVGLLLQLRARARSARDFPTGDLIRDGLTAAGVEVRDTPSGTDWHLRHASPLL